jgi:ATP-dependent Zn protease
VALEKAEKGTAYHEAGHMVAAWDLGLTVTGATIVSDPEAGYAGYASVPVEERVRYADWVNEEKYLYAHLVSRYAGIAASEHYTGARLTDAEIELAVASRSGDHYDVGSFIINIAGPDEAKQAEVDDNAKQYARHLIGARWDRVKKVADVLLERETLDEDECRQVLEEQQ